MKVLLCHCPLKSSTIPHDYTGVFMVAAMFEKNGYTPFVWHGEPEAVAGLAEELRPDAVGFGCDYDNQQTVASLCREVRRIIKDVKLIVGGPQAAALGESFLRESGCDAILRGEGEYGAPMLLDALLGKSGSISGVKGAVYMSERGFAENPSAPLIEDLDALPPPAFHRSLHKGRRYGNILITGRGCPYNCAFCAGKDGRGRIRLRDIGKVLDEAAETLRRRPDLKYLIVMDDTFTTSRGRVLEFCEGMKRLREKYDFVWYCEGHIGGMKGWRDSLPSMVDSGLARLQVGIESGDQRVLDLYNKRVTVGEVEDFVGYAADCGLPQIAANFIVGGPEEAEGATEGLIERLLRLAPGVMDITTGFLRAYPGTEITDNPAKFGLQILDPGGRMAADDYPWVVPLGRSQDDVAQLRQRLNRRIRSVMREILRKGKLPMKAAMSQFRMALHYDVTSRWFLEISDNPRQYEFYHTHYLGEGNGFGASPEYTFPQRTFEFWRSVVMSAGFPVLGGKALSPLEYELLLQCAGKRGLRRITDDMYGRFGKPYRDKTEFETVINETLRNFENNRWITMFNID